MTDVVVIVGPGQIGQAIGRRVPAGKRLLLADLRQENAEAAAETLADVGFETEATTVDIADGGVTASYLHGPLQPTGAQDN